MRFLRLFMRFATWTVSGIMFDLSSLVYGNTFRVTFFRFECPAFKQREARFALGVRLTHL